DEKALAFARQAVALAARGGHDTSMGAADFQFANVQNRGNVAQAAGDIAAAWRINQETFRIPALDTAWTTARQANIGLCGQLHDRACFEAAVEAFPPLPGPLQNLNRQVNLQQADAFFEDWRGVTTAGEEVTPMLAAIPRLGAFFLARVEYPL